MLRKDMLRLEELAKKARQKGLDPSQEVEIKPADDVAGRVEGLVGPQGVGDRIRELIETKTAHDVAFEIAREIVESARSDEWDPETVADQAIRTALAILTEGITAGPIEGIGSVKIKPNTDGSRYLAVYFAGPIRAAGGTEAAQTVIIADAVRQVLDLDQFKPSNEIIERYVEEVDLYNRISHLQYPSTVEEVRLAARNLPIEVTGEPTAEVEVTGYRDLPGVETNRLRGGAILVLNDSILGKAHKLSSLAEQTGLPGWEWLRHLAPRDAGENEAEQKIQPKEKYLEDIIAGRPVLAYPSRKGGFRIRYGRSRNTGLAALGVHPATMIILDNFIACGTQLIIERPGKGCVAMPVNSIHGPIVKLNDGSIQRIDSVDEAKRVQNSIAKILFLGDLLIGFGEFRENNHLLVPAGYCTEWWAQEVQYALIHTSSAQRVKLAKMIQNPTLEQIIQDPFQHYPQPSQALTISRMLNVHIHPRYLYFWEDLSQQQITVFQEWVSNLTIKRKGDQVISLRGPIRTEIEEILESLCIPCRIEDNQVFFEESAPILHEIFHSGIQYDMDDEDNASLDALSILQKKCPFKLRPKGTFYVGARIGRPEKAKRREMSPPPHGIFPVGGAGGSTRDIRKAEKKRVIEVEANIRQCPRCGETTFLRTCPDCTTDTNAVRWCPVCNLISNSQRCGKCGDSTNTYGTIKVPLKKSLTQIRKQFGGRLPERVKGVKGLMSKNKIPELLEKAVLRAKYDLFVYKDGTIRFDMTDAPLTHFKPCEIGVTIEKLNELGYHFDIHGNSLTNEDQILELKTQDIIVPYECAKYLFRVSQFIDELLTSVYKLDPFYCLQSPAHLAGHLIVGLAPHTSAGITGRIIGFTPLRVCYAHPFWHAAKRRNCIDGDEEILIWDTKQEKLLKLPIGSVIEEIIRNGNNQEIVDDFGTIAIDNPYHHWRILSFDPLKLGPLFQPIKQWIKGTSNHWITITTNSGRSITMTPEHNAFVWKKRTNTIEKVKAFQLKQGDHIPILSPEKLPAASTYPTFNILQELAINLPLTEKFQTFKHNTRLRNASQWIKAKLRQFCYSLLKQQENNSIKHSPRSLNKGLSQWKITHLIRNHFSSKLPKKPYKHLFSYDWYNSIPLSHLEILEKEGVFQWHEIPQTAIIGIARDDKTTSPYIQFSKNLCRLLGYYVSEGYIRDEQSCYQTNFSAPNSEIRAHLKHLIQEVLGSEPYYKKDNHQLVHSSRIHAYLFAYAWRMGTSAYTKRFPDFLYSLPKDYKFALLSAYIDGDGSIPTTDDSIQLYSVSEKLLSDIGLLLATISVFYRRRKDPLPGRYGPKVLERYQQLGKTPKNQVLHRISIRGPDLFVLEHLTLIHSEKQRNAQRILSKGFSSERKFRMPDGSYQTLESMGNVVFDIITNIQTKNVNMPSYCLSVDSVISEDYRYNNLSTVNCITGNCDGDEDAVMLALDPMINFSREYLPTSRGGTMDTPLVLSITITPKEVDDEAHHIDGTGLYPLEFYERTLQFADPKDVEGIFDLVAHRIVDHRISPTAEISGLLFSHPTCDVNYGPRVTTYARLNTMQEKVERQLALGQRIAAVDLQDMARRLLDSHFLPDIFGNIRAFTTQKFRCTGCNEKFRRIPLSGVCTNCSGKLVLTVTKAGIVKYVGLASQIVKNYNLPHYYQQRLDIANHVIESIFVEEDLDEQQTTLKRFSPSST